MQQMTPNLDLYVECRLLRILVQATSILYLSNLTNEVYDSLDIYTHMVDDLSTSMVLVGLT